MTEEEKKAIKVLEEFKKSGYYILSVKYCEDRIHTNKLIEKSLETVLNLIQKQDIEINKLKEEKEELEQRLQEIELQILEEDI